MVRSMNDDASWKEPRIGVGTVELTSSMLGHFLIDRIRFLCLQTSPLQRDLHVWQGANDTTIWFS